LLSICETTTFKSPNSLNSIVSFDSLGHQLVSKGLGIVLLIVNLLEDGHSFSRATHSIKEDPLTKRLLEGKTEIAEHLFLIRSAWFECGCYALFNCFKCHLKVQIRLYIQLGSKQVHQSECLPLFVIVERLYIVEPFFKGDKNAAVIDQVDCLM
jgi:hypothetical protein